MYKFVWTPFIGEILSQVQKIEMKMILCSGCDERLCCCWPMTKTCAYNQGVLILEYRVQVENQCL